MSMRTPIAVIFSMFCLIGATAQRSATQPDNPQPPATQTSDAIAALIAQLGAPEFGLRQEAETKLADMGPSVEPGLQHALAANPSDETRTRLNNLIARIEENKLLHASVTMHYADSPVKKILDDFASQSGGDMGTDDPSVVSFTEGRTASVNLDNAGFWEAMTAVSDASGLRPTIGQSGITLAPDLGRAMMQIDLDSPYAKISGGLLIVPRFANEQHMINYHGTTRTGSTILVVDVFPEPKLHVLSALTMDWVRECVDEKGNSLLAPNPNRRFIGRPMMTVRGPQQWMFPLTVNLQEIPGTQTKIARLNGELDFTVQTRSQIYDIDDITRARGVSKSDDQMTVTVTSCSRMNMNYRVDLDCTGAAVFGSIQDFMNSVVLIDDQGQVIQRQSVPQQGFPVRGNGEPPRVRLTVIFQPTQRTPVKLQWEKTIDQKKLSVPFELNDIPLW